MAETGCDPSSRKHAAADAHEVGFERDDIVDVRRIV